MKKSTILFLIIICSIVFYSCMAAGGGTLPKSSENFVPKKEYSKSFDDLWKITQAVLLAERINVLSSTKEDGRISTDYVQGPSQATIFGAQTIRYKYNIVLSKSSQNITRLDIIATLESSSKDIPFHDVSKDNVEKTSGIENSLYEKIEMALK